MSIVFTYNEITLNEHYRNPLYEFLATPQFSLPSRKMSANSSILFTYIEITLDKRYKNLSCQPLFQFFLPSRKMSTKPLILFTHNVEVIL